MVQSGSQEDINLTERTQPILLTASVAVWRVWREKRGPAPSVLAGHSLGEWSALVCADSVSFADAVRLVRLRGAFMQEAVPVGEGAMAAIIGLDDATILDVCGEASQSEVVTAVNYNAPGQVVIAGHAAAVERAVALLKEAGAKRAMPLPVSAPFHTSLMKSAADRLAGYISATEFRTPSIPVIHNVHARAETDPEAIKRLMIEQIDHPVLWVDCVRTLVERGVTDVVECGPGKVLAGLARRIDKDLNSHAAEDPGSLDKAIAEL
jgi:[acyl-carrier-protein] S-malonyltransferase